MLASLKPGLNTRGGFSKRWEVNIELGEWLLAYA